jgi:hypothetical protein
MSDTDFNPFDPENFVVSSALNGVTGKVAVAEFMKTNYGGKAERESTVFRVVVEAANLEKPRELLISCGDIQPSKDGVTADVVGPFFVGKINKGSNLATFIDALKAGGFDLKLFAKAGGDALVGALITFKAIEKTIGRGKDRQVKTYDVPATFVGFEGQATAAVADLSELKTKLAEAIKAAVANNGGELPRGQLSAKLAGVLKDEPNKAGALGLLVDEGFLSSIEGIAYDKKTLKATA